MSKHFELMQEMEKERQSSSHVVSTPIVSPENEPPLGRSTPVFSSESEPRTGPGRPRWANEEALRLVQQIFLLQTQQTPRVVVFAGIEHGNGCTQICTSVAETLAKHSMKPVCLVDANFRSPALPEMYGTLNHHGLTDALLGEGPIGSFAKRINDDDLWLLSCGSLAADSPNLFTSERLGERLLELRHDFEFVIIDAPPLTDYSDAVVLGQHSDGMVMVLEANATRREAAAAAAASLRSVNVPILAAVLNKRTFPIPEKIYNRL
jgi:succinoglycan biosynthesis transport protein ExoP